MICVCPFCAGRFPAVAGIQDAEARRALEAILSGELPPPIQRRLLPYLALHAAPTRAVPWEKVARLTVELIDLIKAPRLARGHGPARTVTPDTWGQAMEEVLEARNGGTLRLPLKGHGYLEEIAYRLADRAEARAERAAEERLRGVTPIGGTRPATPAPVAPPPPPRPARISDQAAAQGLTHIQSMFAALGVHRRPGQEETTK